MGKQLCINRFGQRLCFAAKTIVSSKEGGGGWWDWKCQELEGRKLMVFSGVNSGCKGRY